MRTTLGRVLEQVLPQLQRRAEQAGLQLKVDAGAPDDTPLAVDTEAVGQILFNLVDNACKYAAEADDRIVHLHAAATNGTVRLSVRDHGPGVPRTVAGTIFRPFERGSRNGSDTNSGVGLGLALSRGLARDLGGDLELLTDQQPGACFRLSLPVENR